MSYEAWPSLLSDETQAPCGTPGTTLSRGNERERSKRRPTPALRRSRFVDFSTTSGAAGGQAHGAGGGARTRHSFCAARHFGTDVRSSGAARRLQAQHSAAEGASWSAFAPAHGAVDGSSRFCARASIRAFAKCSARRPSRRTRSSAGRRAFRVRTWARRCEKWSAGRLLLERGWMLGR